MEKLDAQNGDDVKERKKGRGRKERKECGEKNWTQAT